VGFRRRPWPIYCSRTSPSGGGARIGYQGTTLGNWVSAADTGGVGAMLGTNYSEAARTPTTREVFILIGAQRGAPISGSLGRARRGPVGPRTRSRSSPACQSSAAPVVVVRPCLPDDVRTVQSPTSAARR
jgi:hypothetical protein